MDCQLRNLCRASVGKSPFTNLNFYVENQDMISVVEASKIVLANPLSLKEELVPLQQAVGRVLREDLLADRPFPPFDRVTMDGIAIAYDAFEKGFKKFPIEKIQAAGAPQQELSNYQHCIEVMTGASLPKGTDTVIRYEDLQLENGHAEIVIDTIRPKQNVHHTGTDRQADSLIVKAGGIISPAEIGVAATVGKSKLKVFKLPRVVIITTGDELVPVENDPLPFQIRSSNVHKIKTALQNWGVKASTLHLIDDKLAIKKSLANCLIDFDVIILSGGVSKGKFDFVPEVLNKLGVKKYFHKVAQRPGKPFWFGRTNETIVFALPGNPVSSFMCLNRYVRPWLQKCLHLPNDNRPFAALTDSFFFKPDLTYFLQVKLQYHRDGRTLAQPVEGNGSGDLANLVDADAFMELPHERDEFYKGEVFPIYIYR